MTEVASILEFTIFYSHFESLLVTSVYSDNTIPTQYYDAFWVKKLIELLGDHIQQN